MLRVVRVSSIIFTSLVIIYSVLECMDYNQLVYIPEQLHTIPTGVQLYLRKLPRVTQNVVIDKARVITEFLCEFSNSAVVLKNQDKLEAKIKTYIEKGLPIASILLGFPAKSSNTQIKVIQSKLDMAELTGLLTLYHVAQEVKKIYTPGLVITLYTREPFIYQMNAVAKDKLGIDLFADSDIEQYQADLKQLIGLFHPVIRLGEIPNIRQLYEAEYAQLPVEVEDISGYRIFMAQELENEKITDAAGNVLFSAKKADMKNTSNYATYIDLKNAVGKGINKNKFGAIKGTLGIKKYIDDLSESLAVVASKGALRMRALMNKAIADYSSYVRFSIHASDDGDVSSKLGISLLHGFKGSPWHGTLGVLATGIDFGSKQKLMAREGLLQSYVFDTLSLGYIAFG